MSKRKLLLADDSITIQKVVNLTFADEGIEVIAVGDGDSALRKFDEFIPDLVMADVNMPGKNGYEVCRLIKNTDETRKIPVILLVGSFEPFDESEAKDAGADDFLTKPFQSIRQLVNKVTDLLNRRETVAEDSQTETQMTPAVTGFEETPGFEEQHQEAPEESGDGREISGEFGDTGMDDEMIETSAANEYVSGAESSYQSEEAIDYAATQPLDEEDFKGFDIFPAETDKPEAEETFAESQTAESEQTPETAKPPTFEEEARKLSENYEEATEERPEISETEPQIDYYLPEKPEFEKEISDAETLEPEISYSEDDEPREADFSQAPIEESGKAAEESDETETASGESAENEETSGEEERAQTETSLAEETRLREVEEGAEAMPEANIDLSEVGDREETGAFEETEEAETEETPKAETEDETKTETRDEPQAETSWEMPIAAQAAENVPQLNFDDNDLLELPPLVEETGIRPQPKTGALTPEIVTAPLPVETESKITVTKKESEIALSFPPELIEAIAQKVADKISAKTMSDVLPQITELVIKKLAEEKSGKEK